MVEEKTFYVGIDTPHELRKEVLESSKDIIGVLKTYDKINLIRKDKIEKIVELKSVLAEIKRLSMILKGKLPTESIRTSSPKKKGAVKRTKTVSKKPNTEIKKLEDELSEIEEKLNNMGS